MTEPVQRILFITDDQHRFDAFGYTGAWGDLQTPHVDRLAREGTTYTHAVATCPICVPNRFAWCHGLLPSQGAAGLMRNAADWPQLPSLPGIFREQGWQTALIGKLHSFHGDFGGDEHLADTRARGFDDVFEVGGRSLTYRHDCRWTRHLEQHGLLEPYRRDLEARRAHLCWEEEYRESIIPYEHQMDVFIRRDAEQWIANAAADKPFFLHVSFCGPHFPIDPPAGWFGRHNPASMPAPAGVTDAQAIAYWQEMRAAYADLAHLVDHEMGLVFAALEQRGWLDSTLIIHCSDHGDLMGDFGTWHKGKPEDPSLRTPWFMRLPNVVPAGVQSDAPVAAVDIAATCLAAAGITEPLDCLLPQSPSVNWWEHCCSAGAAPRDYAYAECGAWRQLSNAEWKYILYPSEGRERLHHRLSDPLDQTNLSQDPAHQGMLQQLRSAMLARLANDCIAPDTRAFHQRRAAQTADRANFRSQWTHLPQVPRAMREEA